jgi:DNA recombination protein RmuC
MIPFAVGFVIGAAVAAVLMLLLERARRPLQEQALRDAFAALAAQALDANARRLTEQAQTALEGKKELIDQSVAQVAQRLEQIRQMVQSVEASRQRDFGQLGSSVAALSATAGELHRMLASTQRRGAWGERMAEDVLRLAGLQEHVNYTRQSADMAQNGRPDFTFLLPNGLRANMDVKFPLESYKAWCDAPDDAQRAARLQQICSAVRGHIKTVAGRGYIDPHVPTVNYVIVFIPSEQILSLVLSCQPDLMDEALTQRVVLASPLTLYAMLAVIRQAAESANVMKTADQVLALLGQFAAQWQKYKEEMEKLGRALETAGKSYRDLVGARTNMLERPMERIEDLRTSRGIELPKP